MKNTLPCTVGSWCTYYLEIIGVCLILIATLLTIFTQSGLGILSMSFVGLVLCCHRCMVNRHCHHDHRECCPTCGREEVSGYDTATELTQKETLKPAPRKPKNIL